MPEIPNPPMMRVESEANVEKTFHTPNNRFRSESDLSRRINHHADQRFCFNFKSSPTPHPPIRPEVPERKKPKRPPPSSSASKFYTKAD